jgi:uncharacterized caspase-like protein
MLQEVHSGGFVGCFAVAACLYLSTLAVAQPASDPTSPVKRALLIGISKYAHLPNLPGAVNDIQLARQVLVSRFGFPPEQVTVLTNEAATRDGILTALRQLVHQTAPHDVVYIHYSGHGSQVKDLDGDEREDSLDETVVPQDGRGKNIPDITDDELQDILSGLRAQTVVIALDSCHSGTATRDVEVRARAVPADTRLSLYKRTRQRTRGVVPLLAERYVLFTGAAAHEQALDGPVDGRYHGFFTYALFQSLRTAPHTASSQEVFQGAKQELKKIQAQLGRLSMPEPQLEAPTTRLANALFGTESEAQSLSGPPRVTWLEVQPRDVGRVVLDNGLLHGALPGSVWGLYSPGEVTFAPDRAFAFAVVDGQTGYDATAKLTSPGVFVPPKSRARAIAPAPAASQVAVRLRALAPAYRQRLEVALRQRLGTIRIVGPGEFARFVVDMQDGMVRVLSADGLEEVETFPAANLEYSADGIMRIVTRSVVSAELLALDNASSRLQLEVRVVQPRQRGLAVVGRMDDPVFRIRQQGEPRRLTNSLQLAIRTDCDCYLTIVDVDAAGQVNLLFPTRHQRTNYYPHGFIHGGQTVLIPDSLRAGNRAGFYWDYTHPPGTDTLRVFASTDLETAETIRRYTRGQVSGSTIHGAATNDARAVSALTHLRRVLIGTLTRGRRPGLGHSYEPGASMPVPITSFGMRSPAVSSGTVRSEGGATPDWTARSVTVVIRE